MQASSDADLAEPRNRRVDADGSHPHESDDSDEHRLRILVVDDEAAIRDVLSAYLQEHGHHVVAAANGIEALKIFSKGAWDLVMTDGLMPEMSGSEFAHEIKKQDSTVPIFLVSGSSDMVQAAADELSPIDRIIRKPFTRETLATALASLDRSSHRD